jgi:hypothetical protein
MKKIVAFVLILVSFSCGNKKADVLNPMGNCGKLAENYMNAWTTYAQSQSTVNCQAALKSLDAYVNGCAVLTADQRKEYNQSKSELNCN